MGINFVLLVNKQGQTRLAKYTNASMTVDERRALEGEIVRRCLARSEKQVCSVKASARTPTHHPSFALVRSITTMSCMCAAVLLHRASQLQGHLQAIRFLVLPRGRRRRGGAHSCLLCSASAMLLLSICRCMYVCGCLTCGQRLFRMDVFLYLDSIQFAEHALGGLCRMSWQS